MTELKRKINRYDSFTKCKSVVLGTINWSLLDIIQDIDKRRYLEVFLEDLNDTYSELEKIFQKFNIHVDRPKPIEYNPNKKYVTPYFDLPAVKNPISPSDSFLCLADTIVEVPSVQENAFFDYSQYKHIWQNYFDNGSHWISAPIPTHNPLQYQGDEFNEQAEPMFDASSLDPVGNIVLCAEKIVFNQRAKSWLERTFPQFKFVIVPDTRGHLDSYFRILKPGLLYSSLPKQKLPDLFKNWEIIQSNKTEYTPAEIISEFFQDDDYENTNLDVNGFSIDEENFIVMQHVYDNQPETIKQIESHGINCIPLHYDSSRFLNQGIACVVNATNREGSLTNYF